ncbi:tetraacyldisaccharide 4'-kinase [Amylibacter sp.]|nr:tetraacyldisaccharide 4'-kinase [Amylibacter sp.]MDC1247465.1 tetraacyldisaccharide 4'-kinase [Amylibacter sp.]
MNHPPKFWYKRNSFRSTLLLPLSWLYGGATMLRLYLGTHKKIDVPVICVGNINMGGTGKTPVVIDLVLRLLEMGKKPIVVSRGYGGLYQGPIMVSSEHTADDVGDEPILLTGFSEVCVSRNRIDGANMALSQGADIIILDDGLQNPDLLYDLTITVVDKKIGFGNHRVFPAGPLRESVTRGLARTDLIIGIGENYINIENNLPFIDGFLKPLETGMEWGGLRSLAFAGIGQPKKFFSTLKTLGAEIVATREFGDHQKIPTSMLKRLEAEALANNAQLVTTEKDAARLPKEWQQKVLTLPVRLELNDDKVLTGFLNKLF